MTGLKFYLVASILGLTSAFLLAQPADAATVRRHLRCTTVGGGLTIPVLIPTTLPGIASITNNWSTPVPAGAAFTLTVGHHSIEFTLPQEVAPGASFGAGHPDITGPGMACDASYIDTGYHTGGAPPKKLNTFAVPKQGALSTN